MSSLSQTCQQNSFSHFLTEQLDALLLQRNKHHASVSGSDVVSDLDLGYD